MVLETPKITRENVQTKGRRYVAEGRLTVTLVDGETIVAVCRGQGATYRLGFEAGGWFCDCPARSTCAHVIALKLVTVVGRPTS